MPPSPGSFLRVLVLALVVSLTVLVLAPTSPATAQGPPLEVQSQWLRGTWGSHIGEITMVAAQLDADAELEVVVTASPEWGTPNDRWYVVDTGPGGDYRQIHRSAVYPVSFSDSITGLTAADLDSDGIDEIIVSYDGSLEVWDGWPLALDRTMPATGFEARALQVGDVDDDGALEIVYCNQNGVNTSDATFGSAEESWSGLCIDVAIGELDGDTPLEIVVAGSGQVIDGATGQVEYTDPNNFGATVHVGELDGTALGEIVSGSWNEVWVHSSVGSTFYNSTRIVSSFDDFDRLAVGDIDDDGIDEIVFAEQGYGGLRFYAEDGSQIGSIYDNDHGGVSGLLVVPRTGSPDDVVWAAGYVDSSPDVLFRHDPVTTALEWRSYDSSGPFYGVAHGDIDADGSPEIVYTSLLANSGTENGRYFVHDAATGTLEYASPPVGQQIGDESPGGVHRVAVAQLDADAQLELLVAVNVGTYGTLPRVKVFDGLTHVEQYEMVGDEHNNFQNLAVRDIDDDGSLEVVVSTGWHNNGAPAAGFVVYDATTGAYEWQAALDGVGDDYPLLAVGDFDGDLTGGGGGGGGGGGTPGLEIAVAHDNSNIFGDDLRIYDGVGQFEEWSDAGSITALAVQEGTPDILWAGFQNGLFKRFDWNSGTFVDQGAWSGPIYALDFEDLDGDGTEDFIVVGGGGVAFLSGVDNSPLNFFEGGDSESGRRGSLLVDDIDGDGFFEAFVNRGNDGFDLYEIGGDPPSPPDSPVVTITEPATSPITVTDLDYVLIDGWANDPEDGPIYASDISWESNLDGPLGTSVPFYFQFSVGTHTVTASAVDSDGNTGSASTLIQVTSTAPSITILEPADGLRVGLNVAFDLSASAIDGEDGDLSEVVIFSSDQVGTIGYGPSDSVWDLPAGVHVITASVTDLDDKTSTTSVTVEVVDPATCTGSGNVLDEDWESGGTGWTTTGLWHLAADSACLTPGYTSAVTAYYFGQDATCTFDNGARAIGELVSPVFTVPETPELTFSSYRQVEGGGSYDHTVVSVRPTGSSTWTPIWTRTSGDASSTAWTNEPPISLDAWVGQDVQIRFRFDSIDTVANNFLGWFVDDVLIQGDEACPPANTIPVITITSPADGATVAPNVTLTGSVVDPEETDPTASLEWWNGAQLLGQGGSVAATLPIGPATIEARYTDSAGYPVVESVSFTIDANDPPVLTLLNPSPGTTVVEGTPVGLTAAASDTEDGDLTASIQWTSDLDGPVATGGSASVVFSVGVHTLTASVTDSGGQSDSTSTTVTVTANNPPTVDLVSPTDGSTFEEGETISFGGYGNDVEDGDITASLQWSSNLDGALGSGAEVFASLSPGSHTISASVTDSGGASGSSSIGITVTANTPPTIDLVAPADGVVVLEGDPVSFGAYADDTLDGDLTASIEWTSSLDGVFGTGGEPITSALSVGVHTITASATDSLGATGTASITVRVNGAPIVAIGQPADGTVVLVYDAVQFVGTASDAEDGTLDASIEWTSSLSGAMFTGASSWFLPFPGIQTITASVTDSNGATGSASITLVVEEAPDVAITAPADGTTVVVGSAVTFTGTAADSLDGDLSGSIAWSSDLDGALGTGASVGATLSIGTHTITASSTDSRGYTGTATITLVVQPSVPTIAITTPSDGATVSADGPIAFAGTASDAQDGDLTASIAWTSNIDGKIGYGGDFDRQLSAGTHTITATVTDSSAETATDTITLTVEPAPIVEILVDGGLADGAHVVPGNSVTLDGAALGTDSLDYSSQVAWTSDLDGALGTGASISATLSTGVHAITASATDGLGRTGTTTARIFVTIDAPPAVTLGAPTDGAWCYGPPCSVSLSASAIDPEDGDLTAAGVWTSNLEGAIDGDGDGVASLGLGIHTLTYSVTDSGGNVVTRSVLFRALDANDAAPSVSLTSPADATTAKEGDPVALAATASDGDLGDVSAFVEWTLLPAGTPLGMGASLDLTAGVELPTGTHTLRARLVDGALTVDDTVTITIDSNPEPVVAITAPADATTVVDGDIVTFTGTATDEEDGDLAASLAWSSDLYGAIGTGASVATASLSVGTHTITAEAIDSRGATGSASVTITVAANDPPSVAITTPADGTVALDTDALTFTALATDPQDGDISAAVTWTSSLDGAIGTGASVATTLSVGSHTITADVADAQGLVDSASITVTVHRAPTLAISAPADGTSVIETESVSFAASASDPDDGDLTASITWTSSLDGAIGSGAGFATTTLSVGSHTIIAAVTDSNGATASDTVAITILANDPPSVSITAPADGTVALDTDTVTLTAAASDPQDGDLSASVAWTSSLDGAIGSGASITATLSPGTHTITAEVADAQGLADSASITVTIHRAPSLAITAPTSGLAVVQGDSVSFAATASDPDDGDLSAAITWTSSLDGTIGSGASFVTTTLSPGTHTVTATVADSNGGSASDTVTLSVNDVPSLAITAPADGTVVVTGTAVTFTGTASDVLDGDLSGSITWSSDLDGALGTGASVGATPSIGSHAITAMVTDSGGQGASATITLVVQPSAPTIAITTPADGATVSADGPIAFAGTASDAQDGDLTAAIAWTSSLDGKIGYGGSGFDRRLSAGTHTITATVTDSSAETASDSITLTVEPAPAVVIVNADGSHVVPGNSLNLDGSAIGTDSVDISTSIAWTSSIDGAIGTGASISATLSSGVHTISAAATDGLGRTGTTTARVFVTVDAPPAVTLGAPADGAWCYGPPCTVSLAATAIDPEDGDLTAAGVWTSNLEGAIDGDGDGLASLDLGVHALTYTVTDSGGNTMSRSVLFRALDANDAAPTVTLDAPADATTVKEGDPIALAATASDGDLGDVSAFVEWTLLPSGTPLGTGASLDLTAGVELPVGTHTLRARLIDGALSADDTVTITIEANAVPVVTITSPGDGSSWIQGDALPMFGDATDAEDGDLTAAMTWTSDLDGLLGTGNYFDVDSLTLSIGTHVITAAATDSLGATGSATATITVAANDPPTVAITTPADGLVALDTDALTFTAVGTDPQDGDISSTVIWLSDLDGALGVTDTFVTTTLSVGTHTITAEAIDLQSLNDIATITVTIHRAPTISISAPTNGLSVIETEPVTFTASANDLDDGDLTASITWTSSLDGAIGTGGSFTTSTLSVGSHTVTASVTDSNGETVTDTVSVTVAANVAPSVTITAPAGPIAAIETDPVSFAATASDVEDGDLSSSIAWTSDRDGLLSIGPTFVTSTLSVGTHVIDATVADSFSAEGFATVTVTVEANTPPSVAISAPADGSEVTFGDSVTLTGTASDAQDGDLSGSIAWSSSLDGALGTGASIATTTLSIGTHAITASVVDSHGAGASASITLTVRPQPVTVSFLSNGTQDGWIQESNENSGTGGDFANLESGGNNRDYETIRVGDDRKDEQYRSILSFDTSAIPDGATIQSVTLRLRRGNLDGQNPFVTHGNLVIDVKTGTFGSAALEASDFQAVADAIAAGTLSEPVSNGDDSIGTLDATGRAALNAAGLTQLRIRFATDDDDDRSPDILGFYAGETSSTQLPELIVTYQE